MSSRGFQRAFSLMPQGGSEGERFSAARRGTSFAVMTGEHEEKGGTSKASAVGKESRARL